MPRCRFSSQQKTKKEEKEGGKRSWRLPDPGLSPPPAQGRFAGRTQSRARTLPTRPLAGGPGVSPGSRKRFHTTQTPLPTPRWILPADAPVDTTCWRPGGYYRLLHVRRLQREGGGVGGGGVRGRRHRVLQAFNRLGPRWSGAITYAPQTQQVGLLGTERLAPHRQQPAQPWAALRLPA